MNISYPWLKDFVTTDLTPQQLADALTSIGLECGGIEEIETIRGGLRGLVIGKVLDCTDHPDSDHLHITHVDLGPDLGQKQIVCGAPNVAAGQTVVVATVGTTLYDGDKAFQIKKSKIRGVESLGMICAEDEIGTGTSHDGIIVLPNGAAAPGTPAAEYYGIESEYVLEVDLTPNRIDAASHYGVARDLSAWLAQHRGSNGDLRRYDVSAFAEGAPSADAVTVHVDDTEGCVRYCGLTIDGVKVAQSPEWLRNRLSAIGVRPINNIVDITNYVLHGLGQPMHCFDRAKIDGNRVVVRTCAEGTGFTTLDEVERTLHQSDLMICSATRPMCIAGVFGGLDSGVTEETTSVFLESACFNPTRVRKTARRHGLSTDSSFRFERGVDPNGCLYALKVAALLVQQLAGGTVKGAVVDVYPRPVQPAKVDLSTSYMDRLIGMHLPDKDVDTILKALEIETYDQIGEVRRLAVPTYRVDVTRPCDVVEDVLRIYGYNNVPMKQQLRASLSYKTETDAIDDLRRTVAQQLTGAGFNEILNNSLTAAGYYGGLQSFKAENAVQLLNPLSQDLNVMRQTLLFGGLESLSHNINRKNKDLAFYEFGNVYRRNPAIQTTAERPLAPFAEGARLALWMTGDAVSQTWNAPAAEATFFTLKAQVLNVLDRLGIAPGAITMVQKSGAEGYDIYDVCLEIATRSGKVLGTMGIVAKSLARKADIKQPVYFAELDWDALMRPSLKHKTGFAELPKTQPVRRDLALLVDTAVTMAQIEAAVREAERRLLRGITLFDVYEGDKLPAGKKSYAIAITLQDNEKTLNDKAIDATMAKITATLTRKLGAELR